MMDVLGVVVAAGRGSRFGGPLPKQFAALGSGTVLTHALVAIASHPGVGGVVAVLPPDEVDGAHARAALAVPGVLRVVGGGETRARSVRFGLETFPEARYALVHDAARPLVDAGVIGRVLAATRVHGAAIPAIAVNDTVKEEEPGAGFVARTLDRRRLRLAQTPQGSRVDWLREAIDRALESGVAITDEAHALELAGRSVACVEGDGGNVKITTAWDLDFARRRLSGGVGRDLRVGTGFDIHRFEPGRPLVLGGVEFRSEVGLAGHSDADVLLHAAMDAVLGAAALGDIGSHFPPDDPRFENASSATLAEQVRRVVLEQGWRIVNLDVTLLAERPRIRERVEAIRASVASCFGIESARVGIKATTLEGLGSLGRGEGVACQAVALLERRDGGLS